MLSRRCQAGVIGGLVIAMLVFSVILPLILYYQRMTEYSSKQAETGMKYLEYRAMEILDARGLPYYHVVSIGHPIIEVSNTGSIPVTLKRLWLLRDSTVVKMIDLKGDNPLIISLHLEEEDRDLKGLRFHPTLQPGYTLSITLDISLVEAVEYRFYLESDRGILHPREAVQLLVPGGKEFEGPQNILGPSRIYFFSFRWYLYNETDGSLTPWPDGYEEFTIPVNILKSQGGGGKDKYDGIVFRINVLNMDFYQRSIGLDEYTHMWMYYSGGGALQKSEFYIVGVDNGKVTPYTPITIPFNGTATLYFLASSEDLPQPGKGQSLLGYGNLLIHGVIGDLPFSQNIPFVGITFVNPKK
ncbi:MAG: hypothetical protein QXQ29_04800 [Candidatus Bathyarchaeia archaeon]